MRISDWSSDVCSSDLSLSYKPNKDVLLYVLASKGFLTGNTNLVSPIDPFTGAALPQSFKPDTLWNYEIGTKVALLDNRLNINATAFYIDWSKIQLQVRPASGLPYTANAGTARSKGAALEIVARPASALELGTSLAYKIGRASCRERGCQAV